MRYAVLGAVLLSGCATAVGDTAAPEDLVASLAGATYDNAPQAKTIGAATTSVAFTARTPRTLALAWSGGDRSYASLWVFAQEADGVTLDMAGPCRLKVASRGKGAWDAATENCMLDNGEVYDARVTVMPTGLLFSERRRADDDAQSDALPAPPLDFRRR